MVPNKSNENVHSYYYVMPPFKKTSMLNGPDGGRSSPSKYHLLIVGGILGCCCKQGNGEGISGGGDGVAHLLRIQEDVNIESPPSAHPAKRVCDITGYEAPYRDPPTKLRYANTDVLKTIRSLPNEYVQRYLALRNAATVLR